MSSPSPDPTAFSNEGFAERMDALVALGAREPGSAALGHSREWALANAPETQADAPVALIASLVTGAASGDALGDASSGAALVLEAARALAAAGEPVRIALLGDAADSPALGGVELAVYVARACSLPERRDLLSHRVLRERFFRAANVEGVVFEQQLEAPHAALLAAGALRVVALDAPRAPGAACAPAGFGDALVRFVTDATALLKRSHEK